MVLRVSIPSFRKVKEDEDVYTVFLVDVWFSGCHHKIEKRYSEFEELHKQLKKVMKTPEFPPKKVLKWNPKILEQRRLGLHAYFQGIVDHDPLPHALLVFLETDILDHSVDFKVEDEQKPLHQPIIVLDTNIFFQGDKKDSLPDIVTEALQCLSSASHSLAVPVITYFPQPCGACHYLLPTTLRCLSSASHNLAVPVITCIPQPCGACHYLEKSFTASQYQESDTSSLFTLQKGLVALCHS